ncbi:hypothetical protein [Chryseobacterium sp. MMS23-Vi53]|uniref:hypothetical protein n=1 Tax=Chryseobacterium sp. MMS23-Vi53 TaxID=3386644 RepID=UPI0039E73E0A
MYLKIHLETFKLFLDERTFVRYHDSFVTGIKKEVNPDPDILDKLSQYIGYKNFLDFSNTFIKRDEDANFTEVKVSVDNNPLSSTNDGSSGVVINISNTNSNDNKNDQRFNIPDFIKQNGFGILEITFVLLLVTGGVVLPNTKDVSHQSGSSSILTLWGKSDLDKKYMYWDVERFIATDSSKLGPLVDVVPMNHDLFKYFKKIMRKDTMTVQNSLGKVWCSKYNNDVDFFTMDGRNPENGKELKLASEHMILTYAGKEIDSIQIAE